MPRPSMARERRAELIPVIARAFAEMGYRRTTTAELARRCGVQENILYRLWADKKAMFIASIDHVYELAHGIWGRILSESGEGGGAAALLEYEAGHHGEFGLYRIVFAGLSETDDEEIRAALRRMYTRFQRFIAERLDSEAGKQPATIDSCLAAWAIIGLGTMANIGRDLKFLSAQERRRLIGAVGHLVMKGSGGP